MTKDRYNRKLVAGDVVWVGRSIGIVLESGKVSVMSSGAEVETYGTIKAKDGITYTAEQEMWLSKFPFRVPGGKPARKADLPEVGDAVFYRGWIGLVGRDGVIRLIDGRTAPLSDECVVVQDESRLSETQQAFLRRESARYAENAIEGPVEDHPQVILDSIAEPEPVFAVVQEAIEGPEEPIAPQEAPEILPASSEAPREPAGAPKGISETLSERGNRYGRFEDHARLSQALEDVMRESDGWARLAPDQREALKMVQHKVARILNGDPNYADSWHDIAGYATLVDDRLNGNSH